MRKIQPGSFDIMQQGTSLSINWLDMLLHAQQVMPPNGYICDVQNGTNLFIIQKPPIFIG